jgi:hypothetical protein
MSALLDSLLDDERRFRCRVNDAAMAAGRPIVMGHATSRSSWRIDGLCDPERGRSDHADAALVATDEHR